MAILLVLMGHFAPIRGINLGRLGVELFFVLSGRLMAEILFVRGTKLLEFYRRRVARIMPGLLAFVIAYALFSAVILHHPLEGRSISASLLFYANYVRALLGEQASVPQLEHTWSLAVEEHGYIVLSLLSVWLAGKGKRAALTIWILAAAALVNGVYQTYGLGHDYFQTFWRSDVRMASILMSATICIQFYREPSRSSPAVLVALLLTGFVLSVNIVPDVLKYSVGTYCFARVVNSAAELPGRIVSLLSSRVFVTLGVYSYSLYLWQQPFAKAIQGFGSRFILLALALLAGFLSYRYVEAPLRRYLNSIPLGRATTRLNFGR